MPVAKTKSVGCWAWFTIFLGIALTSSVGAVSENSGHTNEPVANPDPQRLVWINPGTFTMGSPTNEVARIDNEGPQTQVKISQGFWMGKYETTQGEYLAVMGTNQSKFKGDTNRPVETVTWNDATNYCAKLTAHERTAGRLPAGARDERRWPLTEPRSG